MTQIPEPGSVWQGCAGKRVAVVWADDKTVVYDCPHSGRHTLNTHAFRGVYCPAPKPPIKHQRWVNLYKNHMSCGYPTEAEADRCKSVDRLECRLIEWEAEN